MKPLFLVGLLAAYFAAAPATAENMSGPKGFYLGVSAGYGKSKSTFELNGVDIGSLSINSSTYGVLAGYRHTSREGFLVGIEGEIGKSDADFFLSLSERVKGDWGWDVFGYVGHMLNGNFAILGGLVVGKSKATSYYGDIPIVSNWTSGVGGRAGFEFYWSDHVSLRLLGSYVDGADYIIDGGGIVLHESPKAYGGGLDLIFGF